MTLEEFLAYLRRHATTQKWAVVLDEVMGERRPTISGPTARLKRVEQ